MRKQKGFTLIELLVVIAIIGLLSTLAVVSLNSARQKSRDSKRVADVKQVQTALELYFQDQNLYPVDAGGSALGAAATICLDNTGFTTAALCGADPYMGLVPAAPTPPAGNAYTYTSADGSSYSITFTLEGATGGLGAGAHTASPAGIQ